MCVHACVRECESVHAHVFLCVNVSVCLCNRVSGVYTPNEVHLGIPPFRC